MVHFANENGAQRTSSAPSGGDAASAEAPTAVSVAAAADRSDAVGLEQLGDDIAELASHLHAATYRLLVMLAEFDRRGGWGWGFRSCAHWLSRRTRLNLGAARE